MQRITTGPLEGEIDKFQRFLLAVQEEAREDGHWKLVSVSLEARHIDPLAVLEAIYEPAERHAYFEHPQRGEALAGAEAVIEATFEGKDRFEAARNFAAEVFEHTVAVGQLDVPLSGPHMLCAFTFEDAAFPDAAFAPATLFVPRWQVSSADGVYVATANLLIQPDSDVEALARRVLAAHDKFSEFDYTVQSEEEPQSARRVDESTTPGSRYATMVRQALDAIQQGVVEKVVVARRIDLECETALHPLKILNRLRNRFTSCYTFSVGNGQGQTFIGASPERLVRLRDGFLFTEAIAGSAPRGATAGEDAALAAALLESEKERREHLAVAGYIAERLAALGLEGAMNARPRLMKLHNVQHLVTPFQLSCPTSLHLLDVAASLHPTPAVGGLPREKALEVLAQCEAAPRGLYAGLVGWFNEQGDGELIVAIRSGQIEGSRISLFAGAGIVAGSNPEAETAETSQKMRALRDCVARTPEQGTR